ncbi:transglutaminase [Lysinibacillus sphaericus]|uniref:transglutaminase-like domain-containing protein n=1 Tax=Lysinibacillus sphaericus TaxID=1421 RepID=UPI0018CFA5A1|nr:transglutaminase-like domain-containing protein [Lysinibacillus sphaericus]MBG9453885.1 transglutaminase [Lysinibacillus sphaericus]MBG9476355.1 transglutaminase [Lysinibacillus sphaericus]MBG9591770.1 transglutaminase [Lysinibacillus sphaericus]
MEFIIESEYLEDYLLELDVVNYSNRIIKDKIEELFNSTQTDVEKAKIAFEFVRDEISHSWDIQGEKVTCNASDVLKYKQGICYAKSNLLAALLRSQGIPTGFCYQRLMLFDTPEKGYSIHAMNAVYLKSHSKWIRLDARGNKTGVNAQFSIDEEKLAFPINKELGEKDYFVIFIKPNPNTIAVLKKHTDVLEMYKHFLPESI